MAEFFSPGGGGLCHNNRVEVVEGSDSRIEFDNPYKEDEFYSNEDLAYMKDMFNESSDEDSLKMLKEFNVQKSNDINLYALEWEPPFKKESGDGDSQELTIFKQTVNPALNTYYTAQTPAPSNITNGPDVKQKKNKKKLVDGFKPRVHTMAMPPDGEECDEAINPSVSNPNSDF